MSYKIEHTDEEWREKLSHEEYEVLRKHGTEPAFTGVYWDAKDDGVYRCRACETPLFSSEAKYDSGTGWPSFHTPLPEAPVELVKDRSFGMARTEVRCGACGSHLGHRFDDGPAPTGQRYCMNSAALELDTQTAADDA